MPRVAAHTSIFIRASVAACRFDRRRPTDADLGSSLAAVAPTGTSASVFLIRALYPCPSAPPTVIPPELADEGTHTRALLLVRVPPEDVGRNSATEPRRDPLPAILVTLPARLSGFSPPSPPRPETPESSPTDPDRLPLCAAMPCIKTAACAKDEEPLSPSAALLRSAEPGGTTSSD